MLLLWHTRWHCSAVSHLITQHETWLGIVWFDFMLYHHVHLAVFLLILYVLCCAIHWLLIIGPHPVSKSISDHIWRV